MREVRGVSFDTLLDASPNPYVLLDPAFTIVWMNEAYLRATMSRRAEIIDRNIFDAFPSDPVSESGRQLRESLKRVFRDRTRDDIPLIRYDIPRLEGGTEERYWSATHTPLLNASGDVILVLQHTVDVTELHRLRQAADASVRSSAVPAQIEGAIFHRAQQAQNASRALAEERDQLRRLFEQAPGFMAVLNGQDHVFSLANSAYSALVGHREVIGLPVREALPEVGAQGFVELLDEVHATGEPYVGRSMRVVLQPAPGAPEEERYLDFVYQPILGPDGAVSGIFVQGHDLTEQRRAEQALQESEARFRLIADRAPVMLWMSDASGKCLYLNRRQREFWGIASEDVSQFDWSATAHPEDASALLDAFLPAMRDHAAFSVEARFLNAAGEYRTLHTDAQPRFGPGGVFAGMIGVNVDVTEVHRAEAALREEARALEVMNQTGAGVAAELDLDRIVQMVTDAGVELTGAKFGAFFHNVVDESGRSYMLYSLSGAPREAFERFPMPRATKVFEPTFNGEGVVRSDDILRDARYGRSGPYHGMPEGHLPVRSYLAVPVRSRSGKVLGGLFFGHPEPGVFTARAERVMVGLAAQAAVAIDNSHLFQAAEREIAQRRAAEEALQSLNASLEQQVAERTEQLRQNEEALRHAQKMEALGKLTGGVAHDFNNLLQVIGGNLHLLAKDVRGIGRADERLKNALDGVARGAKLASQLLAFGRRQPLEPKALDPGRLVRRLDDMLRRALGEAIELEVIIAGGLWNTLVDPAQVENALLNLAINARDAMAGEGKLTIEAGNAVLDNRYAAYHDVRPGQYVMLAVTDTGCGMTQEVMEQAFDPFFTTKPEGQGTGLGLSQVYGFAKQSGGHVKIYSELGHGTTIRLYLPRTREDEDLATAVDTGAADGGTERVLVVEDDEEVRETVVGMLSDLGYRVLKARDAQSALAIVESGAPIDLLFTDVVMPGPLRSTELARKARERLPGIAVLFTSGYTENAILHGGRLDRGVNLLSKPYSQEALARKVRDVLRAKSLEHSAPSAGAVGSKPTRGDAASGSEAGSEPGSGPASEPQGLRVLLVEDDFLIRLSTADMLSSLGHTPIEAGSGAEALDLLATDRIDLLLTDIGLPDMAGGALAAEALRRVPQLRVVFASGFSRLPATGGQTFAQRGVMLRKPYDEAQLKAAIEAARAT